MLSLLPNDIIVSIMIDHLSIGDVSVLSRVCRSFHHLIYGNLDHTGTKRLWRQLYRRDLSVVLEPKVDHRTDYIRTYPIEIKCYARYKQCCVFEPLIDEMFGHEQLLKRYIQDIEHPYRPTEVPSIVCKWAFLHNYPHVIDYLVSIGKPYIIDYQDIYVAASNGYRNIIKCHFSHRDNNDHTSDCDTVVRGAARGGHLDIVKEFYPKTLKPHMGLSGAVEEGHIDIVRFINDTHKIDPHMLSKYLADAIYNNQSDMIDEIISMKPKDYHPAIVRAAKNKNTLLVKRLVALLPDD